MQITTGATMQCSFGAAPAPINILPTNRVMAAGMPAATIMDFVPVTNIPPFGTCSSLANPTVAAATATALGALTPMPCIPATSAPWTPGVATTLIGDQPALDSACMLTCVWGGLIQFTAPAQVTVAT